MLILDRFEGELAVIEENGAQLALARALLPAQAREGDVLRREESGAYVIDEEATAARRAAITARLKRLTSRKRDHTER